MITVVTLTSYTNFYEGTIKGTGIGLRTTMTQRRLNDFACSQRTSWQTWFGQNCWKLCLVERAHLDSWVDFFWTVCEFCWLATLLNLTDRYVFIIIFLFNGEALEQQLHSVHCIGSGLQNSRCKIVERNGPSNFLKLQGNGAVNVYFTIVLKFTVQVRVWTLFRNCAVAESAYRASLTMNG